MAPHLDELGSQSILEVLVAGLILRRPLVATIAVQEDLPVILLGVFPLQFSLVWRALKAVGSACGRQGVHGHAGEHAGEHGGVPRRTPAHTTHSAHRASVIVLSALSCADSVVHVPAFQGHLHSAAGHRVASIRSAQTLTHVVSSSQSMHIAHPA